jgi:hypothetical protein
MNNLTIKLDEIRGLSKENREQIISIANELQLGGLNFLAGFIGSGEYNTDIIKSIRLFCLGIDKIDNFLTLNNDIHMLKKDRNIAALLSFISISLKVKDNIKKNIYIPKYKPYNDIENLFELLIIHTTIPNINIYLEWFIEDNIFNIFNLVNNISEEKWFEIFKTVIFGDSNYPVNRYNLGTLILALDEIIKEDKTFTGDKINISKLRILFNIIDKKVNEYERGTYKNLIKDCILNM